MQVAVAAVAVFTSLVVGTHWSGDAESRGEVFPGILDGCRTTSYLDSTLD